ncbi:MAG: tetratricopeptide repeat protein [Myxococcota bacterium]
MARESGPAADRGDSTMELLAEDLGEEAAEAGSAAVPPGPDRAGPDPRTAETLPPPPAAGGATAEPAPEVPADGEEALRAHARELIRGCEAELTSDPEPRRAGRLHYEIARLYESALGDDRRASAHYQEALRYVPEHVPAIRGARRTFVARRNPRAALPLFDAEARLLSDPRRKAALYLAKGRLLEDVLGRRPEARNAYATAFELDRSHPAILKALEQVHTEGADWEALDRVLERAANVVSDDLHHRAALIVQRAQVLEARRGDVDGAIELYETALRLDPTASGAVEALKRLHHQQRRFRDLIRVLEVESQHAADPAVRAMALYRIGRVHLERLGNRDEALSAFERAVREVPDDLLVLEELVPLYQAAGRMDRMVEVLGALADLARDPGEKVALLHRMGGVHEQALRDDDEAIRCYREALRLSPDHVPTLQALGRLYARLERLDDLVGLHAHEAEHAHVSQRRAAAHVRAAELLEHRLGRKDDAAEHHARALSVVPGHPAAFKGLARLLTEARRWRELVELYERAVELARRPAEAAGYLFKVGSLYEDVLGEPVQAAQTYRRILALVPNDMQAIHALQRTTERAGRWQDYLDALQLEIAQLEDDEEKVPLLHRMGEVLHDHLGDWSGAVERLREALALDAGHGPTLGTLGRLYHDAGRWEDLLEVYERELQLAEDDPRRVTLLARMAELCSERIGRDAAAVEYYERILRIDPAHGQALREVVRLLEEHGDHDKLLGVLQVRLQALDDPQARARTAYKMAQIHEQRLDDPAQALRAYEKALAGMPGHRPSLDAAARLRATQSAWKPLVDGLVRDAGECNDPFLAIDALVEAGEVCLHRLGDPKRALDCYEQAAERAPDNLVVLLGLEKLHRRVGNRGRLAEVLQSQAEVFADRGARLAALRELLRLRTQEGVGSDEEVAATCEAILELAPDDPVALEVLEERALREADRDRLVYVDSRLAASVENPLERAAHHTRLGESLEARGEPAAIEAYRAALGEDPENIAATRGLSRIASRMEDPEALAEAARREARVTQDGEAAADLLVRSAAMRADHLGDASGAVGDLIQALELAPDHAEAAQRLDALLSQAEGRERLADLLGRAANGARRPERRAALWKRVADLQAEHLGQVAAAISSLNRVLRTAPDDLETVRRLAELYERDGQWNEAINLRHRILQLAPDSDVLLENHLRLAALYEERAGETERALVSLQAVLALDPRNTLALRRLAELHERQGRLPQAREATQRLVEAVEEGPDRAGALTLLARIELASGRQDAARAALCEAVTLEGPGGEAALEYRTQAEGPAHWNAYVDALWEHVRREPVPFPDGYLEIARVLAEHLGRPDAALEALDVALEETAGDPLVRRELAVRLQAVGRHDRALEQLQRLVEQEPLASSAWRELANAHQRMGQPQEARLATEPLVVLGSATGREQERLVQHPARPAAVQPASLDAAALRRTTRFGPADRAAADLLGLLARGLGKLYPADLEAFGLAARDRLGPRSEEPLRALVSRLCDALGSVQVDVYVHRIRSRGVCVELGDPPALLVPAALLELPLSQQVFLVARPLVQIAQGFEATDKLTPRELEVLLASAARSVEPGFGRGLTSEEFLDNQARRIHRALPRRTRKSVQQAATRYVETPKVDFGAWYAAIRRTSHRIAALMADDLPGVMDALRSTERELSNLEGAEMLRASPVALDLLRFWGTDQAMALRAQLGLLS